MKYILWCVEGKEDTTDQLLAGEAYNVSLPPSLTHNVC